VAAPSPCHWPPAKQALEDHRSGGYASNSIRLARAAVPCLHRFTSSQPAGRARGPGATRPEAGARKRTGGEQRPLGPGPMPRRCFTVISPSKRFSWRRGLALVPPNHCQAILRATSTACEAVVGRRTALPGRWRRSGRIERRYGLGVAKVGVRSPASSSRAWAAMPRRCWAPHGPCRVTHQLLIAIDQAAAIGRVQQGATCRELRAAGGSTARQPGWWMPRGGVPG